MGRVDIGMQVKLSIFVLKRISYQKYLSSSHGFCFKSSIQEFYMKQFLLEFGRLFSLKIFNSFEDAR